MGALRDFVAEMLESEGAAIESVEPDGLEVLAPNSLRTAMSWPEFVRLGFGATVVPGAIPVGLEGDWLDRFGALLCGHIDGHANGRVKRRGRALHGLDGLFHLIDFSRAGGSFFFQLIDALQRLLQLAFHFFCPNF